MQETRVVSFIQKHVVSDHCEATALNGKLHATLLITCVPNVKKYFLLHSILVRLYSNNIIMFIILCFRIILRGKKETSSIKIIGKC